MQYKSYNISYFSVRYVIMKYRRKTVVIPYIKTKNDLFFIIVKDKENNEWTFVTGGAKPNESFETCALRELHEETKGALDLRKHGISLTRFYSFFFKNEIIKDKVLMHYKVIFLPMQRFGYDPKSCFKLESQFMCNNDKYTSPEYNETTYLKMISIRELYNINMWLFMRNKVLMSPYFIDYIRNVV